MIYSGVCMCVKGCALIGAGEEWELGACRAAFHVQAEPRDPEARAGALGQECNSTKQPQVAESPHDHSSAWGTWGGGGASGLFSGKNCFPRGSG